MRLWMRDGWAVPIPLSHVLPPPHLAQYYRFPPFTSRSTPCPALRPPPPSPFPPCSSSSCSSPLPRLPRSRHTSKSLNGRMFLFVLLLPLPDPNAPPPRPPPPLPSAISSPFLLSLAGIWNRGERREAPLAFEARAFLNLSEREAGGEGSA